MMWQLDLGQTELHFSHNSVVHIAVKVEKVAEEPAEPVQPAEQEIIEQQIQPQQPFWGNIVKVNWSSFILAIKTRKLPIFKASLYDINKEIEVKNLKERPLEEAIPEQYHEFVPLISKVLADRLKPH